MATVVIPWREAPRCKYRDRALEWVVEEFLPNLSPLIASSRSDPWSKASAIFPALDGLSGVVVVSDADVVCDLTEAIQAVEDGAPWAKPHRYVFRLTEEATQKVYEGAEPHEDLGWEERHLGLSGGGIVVAPAETLRAIPPDPRFLGWGHEDLAWGQALHVLAGEGWRGAGSLYHLWHPPQERRNRKMGSAANYELFRRYVKARRDPELMKGLVQEAHDALRSDQSPLLSGASHGVG